MIGPYQLNSIIHGDCLTLLGGLPSQSIDLIFTSPPYNLGTTTGGGFPDGDSIGKWGKQRLRSGKGSKLGACALADGYGEFKDDMNPSEYKAWQQKILLESWRVIKSTGAIYYNHKPRVQAGVLQNPLDLNPGLPIRQIIIWKRAGGVNFSPTHYLPTHEYIIIFAKPDFRLKSQAASGAGDVWEFPQDTNNPHPAPFPVGLPYTALETVMPGVVLDPFMGSGTTGVAAKMLGIDYLGFEINPDYIGQAQERIARTRRQISMFQEPINQPNPVQVEMF